VGRRGCGGWGAGVTHVGRVRGVEVGVDRGTADGGGGLNVAVVTERSAG
jgi:hypothetical protein